MSFDEAVRARLDDADARAAVDVDDALGDVEGAAERWKTARDLPLPPLDLAGARLVVVAGVGGSGVAGDVAAALACRRGAVPVVVHKHGTLPGWVGPGVVVLACSHSGRTAETRAIAAAALDAGAQVVTISAGGPLADFATAQGLPVVRVPAGPPPRHALGSLLVPQLRLLGLDADLDEAIDRLGQQLGACGRDVPAVRNPAKQLGAALADGRLPVVFGGDALAAVAAHRLKTQLNENAKLPALVGALPDLAHHEVMGWERPGPLDDRVRLVWVRDRVEPHAVTQVTDLLTGRGARVAEVVAEGTAPLARLATLLVRADFVSVYTALARGVDPSPIATIERLKQSPPDDAG